VLATVIDITGRKRAEDMQRLVVRELQHRMRNALAVVQAIAIRTLEEDVDSKDVRTTLLGRIKALAQAYELAQTDGENVSLARIIERQVAAHGDRVVVQGCDVAVSPRIAQLLSLVVHELTTNAVKHGALSGTTGIVVVTGQVKADGVPIFLFTWQEQGGPSVALPTPRVLARRFCKRRRGISREGSEPTIGPRGFSTSSRPSCRHSMGKPEILLGRRGER
jgi:two-component sensor histidine kinase